MQAFAAAARPGAKVNAPATTSAPAPVDKPDRSGLDDLLEAYLAAPAGDADGPDGSVATAPADDGVITPALAEQEHGARADERDADAVAAGGAQQAPESLGAAADAALADAEAAKAKAETNGSDQSPDTKRAAQTGRTVEPDHQRGDEQGDEATALTGDETAQTIDDTGDAEGPASTVDDGLHAGDGAPAAPASPPPEPVRDDPNDGPSPVREPDDDGDDGGNGDRQQGGDGDINTVGGGEPPPPPDDLAGIIALLLSKTVANGYTETEAQAAAVRAAELLPAYRSSQIDVARPIRLTVYSSAYDKVPTPKSCNVTWNELDEYLTKNRQLTRANSKKAKLACRAISFVRLSTPSRAGLNVTEVTAIALEFDHASPPEIYERIERFVRVEYSTYSYTSEKPRYRVVICTTRAMEGQHEYVIVMKAMFALLEGHCDRCIDASHIFFAPSCPKDNAEHAYAKAYEGQPLDPDVLLAGGYGPVSWVAPTATQQRPARDKLNGAIDSSLSPEQRRLAEKTAGMAKDAREPPKVPPPYSKHEHDRLTSALLAIPPDCGNDVWEEVTKG